MNDRLCVSRSYRYIYASKATITVLFVLLNTLFATANTKTSAKPKNTEVLEKPSGTTKNVAQLLSKLRDRVKELKFEWDLSIIHDDGWEVGGQTVDGYPLIYWKCGESKSNGNTALVLSAVHADEITPVYFGFRLVDWLRARPEICKNKEIVVAPFVNPDGFFRYSRGTRTNFNKVDLNRNFDTPDWAANAQRLWKEKYKSQRRYFPGDKAASEPETLYQQWLVTQFKPNKILSVHAPLNMLDYDGPADQKTMNFMKSYLDSCEQLKQAVKTATPDLRLFAYGMFPGSLGNFAGKQRGVPVLTVELPSVDHSKAGHYFSMMEKGTRVFFEYEIKDSPIRSASTQQ